MNRKTQCLIVVIVLLMFTGCQNKTEKLASEGPAIRIGYMICNSLEESKARFEPITAYLSEKLGRRFESVYVNTFEFEDLVRDKKIDFTHSNSTLYIIFNKKFGAKLIAAEVRGRHGYKDSGAIIARKESGIQTFDDMRGKSMVFGPALAPFGYMAQYYLMLENGFDPEKDLSYYAIPWGSWKHEKVIYGVLFGGYDLGAAPRIDLDKMAEQGRINLDDFTVVAESIAMPYCTVASLAHVDPGLAQEVKETLLGLKKDETALVNGEVLRVLGSAFIEGFVEVEDSEYDSIREQLKRCNMDPYREF
jgi:ABC-type phosphate/phosphonate transport system substrate-binding protein